MGIARQLVVLKCKLYCFSDTVRPSDQETIVTKKIVCYMHRSQEVGYDMLCGE